MKHLLLLALVFAVAVSARAQTENAPAEPATDEYGIPLKLENPSQNAKALPGPSSPAAAPKTDAYGMPLQTGASQPRAAAAKPRATVKTAKAKGPRMSDGGASGKLVHTKLRPKQDNSPMPQVVAPEILENQATQELILPPKDLSTGVLPTPSTVRTRVEGVHNPVGTLPYRFGVSLQPFSPNGQMTIGGLAPYDLSGVGWGVMPALEGQWLPFKFSNVPGLQAGFFASAGYAQFNVNLRSPAGIPLDGTKLHVIKAQAGATASYQLPRAPLWSVHGNLGLGRLMEIQSSESQYANASTSTLFASAGLDAERSLLPNLSVYAGYDFRLAVDRSTAGADVPMHNVLLGFLGNFE